MTSQFDGRVALATGVGSGLGKSSAQRLSKDGANVAANAKATTAVNLVSQCANLLLSLSDSRESRASTSRVRWPQSDWRKLLVTPTKSATPLMMPLAKALGYADEVSDTVVDVIGDASGGIRHHEEKV